MLKTTVSSKGILPDKKQNIKNRTEMVIKWEEKRQNGGVKGSGVAQGWGGANVEQTEH